jgi:N12 class adenine-specific DNA methylase
VLLDHVVGAGKTGTMFMGAMEPCRLGLVRQPDACAAVRSSLPTGWQHAPVAMSAERRTSLFISFGND